MDHIMVNVQNVKKSECEVFDRISDLPDPILCKILSYVPTKNVVGTCILSKRWNNFDPFGYAPIFLDIDDSLYLNPYGNIWGSHRFTSFIGFVSKLLYETLRNVPCVESMTLNLKKYYGDAKLMSWVSAALKYNVKKLVLNVHLDEPTTLFGRLNGCKTLVSLKFVRSCDLYIPDIFSLPCLKQLEINGFEDGSISEFLKGCPVLEELTMRCCNLGLVESFSIRCPLLKDLTITKTCINIFDTELELHAPNLETLMISNCVVVGASFPTLSSLIRAHLCFDGYHNDNDDYMDDEDYQYIYNNVAKIVAACSNTKWLYLSKDSLMSLHHSNQQLPQFWNLTWLTLNCERCVEAWDMLACLLLVAPNLKELTFEEGFDRSEGGYTKFIRSVPSLPTCLELNLQKIEFHVFEYNEDQINLFEYFLRNGKALEKLILRCYPSIDTRIVERLLTLPNHSKIIIEPNLPC